MVHIVQEEVCMGTENVFNENQEYLIKARELVSAIDDIQDELDQAHTAQKKTSRSIAQEEKGLSDEISSTLKSRKNEIEDGYDKQLSANGAKIRQLQSKKDKKKNERMGNRIESETAELNEANRQLRLQAKELYKQNHVPGFCNTGFFYCLFIPNGFGEIVRMLLLLILFCGCIPALVSVLLMFTVLSGGADPLLYAVITLSIVIVEFILYFVVYNSTKVKYYDVVREGRKLRNKINANSRQIRAIKSSITKDKDESVYNLGKYDEKLGELESEREEISNRKLEAIKVFENDTKKVITDEITNRRQPKIDEAKGELKRIGQQISDMETKLSEMQTHLTESYVTFLGKDLCTEEKLSDLISIMEEGLASTVSGAIEIYKSEK